MNIELYFNEFNNYFDKLIYLTVYESYNYSSSV